MNAHKRINTPTSILLFAILLATSCSTFETKELDSCPVVASMEQIGDNSVLVCKQELLKDTIRVPLSLLTDELQIIRLDNKEEALVGDQMVVVSNNYLLIWNKETTSLKLFDRKGNFITPIGAVGQGPGEYWAIYDAHIDELHNRVYLLPWTSTQILVYDLQGNSYPPLPICLRAPKGKLFINTADSLIAAVILPFPGSPAAAWTQDFHSNRISFIEPGSLTAFDYNSELYSGGNTSAFDVMFKYVLPTRKDTLYHYDYTGSRLQPRFTVDFTADPIPNHSYQELPHHFVGSAAQSIQISKNMFGSSTPVDYIIDKETHKGAYMHLTNDFLGDENLPLTSFDGSFPPFPNFRSGYYILNMDPGELSDKLTTSLRSDRLTAEKRQKLTELIESIQPNDNNYIFLARLKQ